MKYIKPDDRYPDNWNKLRYYVFKRDGFRCQRCGSRVNLECHHIIPLGMGGTNHPNNLITLCHRCHEMELSSQKAMRKKRK